MAHSPGISQGTVIIARMVHALGTRQATAITTPTVSVPDTDAATLFIIRTER